jgi:hypothetical protein
VPVRKIVIRTGKPCRFQIQGREQTCLYQDSEETNALPVLRNLASIHLDYLITEVGH